MSAWTGCQWELSVPGRCASQHLHKETNPGANVRSTCHVTKASWLYTGLKESVRVMMIHTLHHLKGQYTQNWTSCSFTHSRVACNLSDFCRRFTWRCLWLGVDFKFQKHFSEITYWTFKGIYSESLSLYSLKALSMVIESQTVIQICDDIRVSKRCQTSSFWKNFSFQTACEYGLI